MNYYMKGSKFSRPLTATSSFARRPSVVAETEIPGLTRPNEYLSESGGHGS